MCSCENDRAGMIDSLIVLSLSSISKPRTDGGRFLMASDLMHSIGRQLRPWIGAGAEGFAGRRVVGAGGADGGRGLAHFSAFRQKNVPVPFGERGQSSCTLTLNASATSRNRGFFAKHRFPLPKALMPSRVFLTANA